MSSFVKNVATMSIAPIVTQALSFLVTPIITRLYTPEDFGNIALFGAIVMPFAIFANMGYSTAIVVTERDEDAANLFGINVLFTFIVALLSSTLILLKNSPVISWIHAEDLRNYLWLIPLSILFHGLYMTLRYWNIRNKRFGNISAAKIFRFITNNGIVLISGFSGFASGFVLIFGGFAGGIASPVILSRSVLKEDKQLFFNNIRLSAMKAIAKKYSKYPKFILLNDLISRTSSQIPIYLFSIYFSQAIIGFYMLGLRLLTIPMNFIGGAIGEVFFQEASQNKQEVSVMLKSLFKYLVLFGFPVFCFLGIIGEDFFYVIFGKDWSEAGFYAQILSLFLLTKFITIPASFLMLIYEKQEFSIYLNVAIITVSSISLIIGGIMHNVYLSLILFSLSNSLVTLIYGLGFMKFAGLKLITMFTIIARMLIICIPLIVIITVIKLLLTHSYLYILILSIIVLIVFYSIVMISSPEPRKLLFIVFEKAKRKINS